MEYKQKIGHVAKLRWGLWWRRWRSLLNRLCSEATRGATQCVNRLLLLSLPLPPLSLSVYYLFWEQYFFLTIFGWQCPSSQRSACYRHCRRYEDFHCTRMNPWVRNFHFITLRMRNALRIGFSVESFSFDVEQFMIDAESVLKAESHFNKTAGFETSQEYC